MKKTLDLFASRLLKKSTVLRRHLSDADAVRYGCAELSIEEAYEFEEHYCVCDDCAGRLVIAFQSRLFPADESATTAAACALQLSPLPLPVNSSLRPATSNWRFPRLPFASSVALAATVVLTSALFTFRPVDLQVDQIDQRSAPEPSDIYFSVSPAATRILQKSLRKRGVRQRSHPTTVEGRPKRASAMKRFVPPAYTYWRAPEPAILADTRVHRIPLAVLEPIRFNVIPQLPPPKRNRMHRAFTHIARAFGWIARH